MDNSDFNNALEKTLSKLNESCSGYENVICGPLNGYGMFGWQFECTDPEYSNKMQGDLKYGIAYLRHMIKQGFSVGFAAWAEKDYALVCLKTWEPGEDEPEWPRNTESATVYYHESPSIN